MVLVCRVELIEISAPAPDSDYKIFMILGMLMRIEEHLSIYGIDLELMSAKVDKRLDEGCHLFLLRPRF